MPEINDAELISKLLRATQNGKIAWEKTGVPDQLASSYAGKWTLTVDKTITDPDTGTVVYSMTITNTEGEEVLRIWGHRDNELPALFEQARRHALKVDEALNDLLKEIGDQTGPEISDEDIPF